MVKRQSHSMQKEHQAQALEVARQIVNAFLRDGDVDATMSFINPNGFSWIGPGQDEILFDIDDVRRHFKRYCQIATQSYHIADETYQIGGTSVDSCIVIAKIKLQGNDTRSDYRSMLHFSFYFQRIDDKFYISHYHVHIPFDAPSNLNVSGMLKSDWIHMLSKMKGRPIEQIISTVMNDCGLNIGSSMIIYPSYNRLLINGKIIELTSTESNLLMILAQNINQPVAAAQIYEKLWSSAELKLTSTTLKTHISNLRHKIQEASGGSIQIIYVKQQGYQLNESLTS